MECEEAQTADKATQTSARCTCDEHDHAVADNYGTPGAHTLAWLAVLDRTPPPCTRWPDGTRYIPEWHCVSCGRLAGEDTVRSAVRWLYWTPPSDKGWTYSLKVCASCQGDRWRSMCRSYDETRSGDLPGVKAWSERLFDFIARRMIQDGVDEDDVAADTFRIGQAVNKLWIDPYED